MTEPQGDLREREPLLAVDTSGSYCSVALLGADGLVASEESAGDGDHFERLTEIVASVLSKAKIPKESVREVAVGVGPGSFTGIRIGLSFVTGFAWGRGVPISGFSSFEACARAATAGLDRPVTCLVVSDARRDEVFLGQYRRDGAEFTIVAPPAIVSNAAYRELSAAGDPLVVTPQRGLVVDDSAVGEFGRTALGGIEIVRMSGPGGFAHEASIAPEYLRAVAALTIEERRALAAQKQ